MEVFEKEKKSRWTTILLAIGNIIIWTIIAIIAFFYNGIVNALTPVEANFNYTQNGQSVSYNIKPDGGTTGFIYENEFFGQTISQSAYKHYLPSSGTIGEIKTNNINGYFQNPCGSGQDISYTMKINFYKQPSDQNTMAWVRVTNGIDGCTGYFEVINGVYTYNNVCNLKSGDVPKFSLYFEESSRGQTYYRVGIPINFSYTCQVGNQAIIDSNNANTNKMIENQNQNTSYIIEYMNQNKLELEASFVSVNPDTQDFVDYEDKEDALFSLVDNADTSNVNISVDSNASGFIWQTITSFLTVDSAIMTLLITLLSIGILKLILNR